MKPCSNPFCTNQVNDTDRFCGICGTYVGPDITLAKQGMQCPNCGAPIQPQQKFCPDCGSWTTTDAQKNVPTLTAATLQANVPILSTSHVSPPLKITRVTYDEIGMVTHTSKNVYAPYMRKIHSKLEWFDMFSETNKVVLLEPILDLTDFTLQAHCVFGSSGSSRAYAHDAYIGIVFRLNDEIGKGLCFLLSVSQAEYHRSGTRTSWKLHEFFTHSSLTNEPLPQPRLGDQLSSSMEPSRDERNSLVSVVAQGDKVDFYIDLEHKKRFEVTTVMQGKLGLYLTRPHPDNEPSDRVKINTLKVWVP